MVVRNLICLLIVSVSLSMGAAFAQSEAGKSEARIRIVVPRIDHAEDDLKWLIELSPTADLKKQWKQFKDVVLDAFTQGFDLSQPMVVDYVFHKDELANEARIPVANFDGKDGLLKSLEGIGFTVKPITKGSFYEVFEKGQKPYFLRYDKGYAWVSRVKEPLQGNLPAAMSDMAPLLDQKKDVILQVKNDAAGVDSRRATFAELRKQFESMIKLRRNEEKSIYELRKLTLVHQLDEAEPFVVEAENINATWQTTTEGPTPHGRGEMTLSALPGTELQKTIEEFSVKPSYFANVTLHPHPVVAGKMNFALSDTRIKRAKEFYKAVRPIIDSKIDNRAQGKETADQKKSAKQATNKFFDMLEEGASLKVVDSFIDAYAVESGKNALVCGIRVVNGKTAEEILDGLKGMRSGWQVKKLEDHGEIAIHELTVPKERVENFRKFFAGESTLYVGIGKDAIWGSAGVDAVKNLKAAIDQAATPATGEVGPVFLNYSMQVGKMATLIEAINLEDFGGDAPKTKEQEKAAKDAQKKVDRLAKLAEEAMKGCESEVHGELRRTGSTIEGFMEVNECALKYIGAVFADQVKEMVR